MTDGDGLPFQPNGKCKKKGKSSQLLLFQTMCDNGRGGVHVMENEGESGERELAVTL